MTATVATSPRGTGTRSQGDGLVPVARDGALDIAKGLLVVAMVIYHWLNVFVTDEGAIYKYLRFVTPSFIFVAGYLITAGYARKSHRREIARRLAVRGGKLLVLFTALNLGAVAVGAGGAPATLAIFLSRAPSMYWAGEGKHAAFEVLVPIAYLLVGAGIAAWAGQLHPRAVLAAWGLSVLAVYGCRWHGADTTTLELLSMGLLGMVAGCAPRESIERLARRPWVWGVGYVAYALVLGRYDAVYELQVVGLVIVMMLLYLAGERLAAWGAIGYALILLGQYSLLAYIVHIVLLKGWARLTRPPAPEVAAVLVAFGVALVGTWSVAGLTRWMRRRSAGLDSLYRAVFA